MHVFRWLKTSSRLVNLSFIISLLSMQGGVLGAQRQAKAHVHGKGALSLVLDANNLQIELELPLADLSGFEHEPATGEQREKLSKVLAIETYREAIRPNLEAGCEMPTITLEQHDVKEVPNRDHDHGHGHGNGRVKQLATSPVLKHEKHQDLKILMQFKCQRPKLLESIQAQILSSTPTAMSLQARYLAHQKQGFQVLTRQAPILSLR